MALSAIRTRILPGVSVNGNRRVAVFGGKYVRMVVSVPELYETDSQDSLHREALRRALPRFPDGWAGDYAGGAFDGDYVWVRHAEPETPHTDVCLTFGYLGQSA